MNVKPAAFTARANVSVLREKTVTGMNCLGFRRYRRRNDGVDVQITLARRSRTNADRFVSHAHVQTFGVRFGIDRNREIPSSRQARMMRTAISPRLAISTLRNMSATDLYSRH